MPFARVDRDAVVLDTTALSRRILFTVIILGLVSPAIYRSYQIFLADRIIRGEQTVENYTRALRHDPSNATLWWHRGRLRHYSLDAVDLPLATNDYQTALSLNPRLSQAWIDLADCYERTGRYQEAEAALDNAFATHTYSPITRWQAGNFFLRRGNLPRMYECFKMACEYDQEKLGIAMQLAWRVDKDHAGILRKLIPDKLPADLHYMDFLVSHDELDLAMAAWRRALKDDVPPEYEFRASFTFALIDRLLAGNRVAEAGRLWGEALGKGGIELSDGRAPGGGAPDRTAGPPNLVWNGSFESEILRGGFDWRFPDMQAVQFQIDLNNRMGGLKCLKVTFEGTNITFAHLSQIVPIPKPGDYVLEFYIRTEGLSTDQRPYFLIQGYPDFSGASLRTEPFPESTGWRKISAQFEAGDRCKAVQLTLRRDISAKFDNQIKGTLWLDGVSIRSTAPPAANRPESGSAGNED